MSSKVAHGFLCINDDSEVDDPRAEENTTVATELTKLTGLYNQGMNALLNEDGSQALSYFHQILSHEMSIDVRQNPPPEGDPLHALLLVCLAALKQRGEMLIHSSPLEAFECLKEAFKINSNDPVLCKKLGTLALEIGYVALAKHVLESMLELRPDYIPLKIPLMEVCLELQEYEAALEHAQSILKHFPNHERAKELVELSKYPDVLLEPVINRRIEWEHNPEQQITISLYSGSWTALLRATAEIIGTGGQSCNEMETGNGMIVIRSIKTNWATLATAKIICEVNRSATDPKRDTESDSSRTERDTERCSTPQGTKSRFPLRSRLSLSKGEEGKTWNVYQSIKCAFPPDEWERLLKLWTTVSLETVHDDKTADEERESIKEIAEFFHKIGADQGIAVQSFAIELLEHRMQQLPMKLEKDEAGALCRLDGLIGFVASPSYCLSIAELLLDAAVSCGSINNGNTNSSMGHRGEKLLQRSLHHLHKCIEYMYIKGDGGNKHFHSPESMARIYWALGKLQLIEGRCHDAEKAFETALKCTAMLRAPLELSHIHDDAILSTETVQMKLLSCLYHDIIDSLPETEEETIDTEDYEDLCVLLFPVLLSTRNDKSSVISPEYRYRGLRFLKEASNQIGEIDTELNCFLHLLDASSLSPPIADIENMESHSAMTRELPTALKTSIGCIPKKVDFLLIMTFVTFVQEHLTERTGLLVLKDVFPSLREPSVKEMLERLIGKSLRHLEWCFWRFCTPGSADVSTGKHECRRRALHEAACFVFVLIQLVPQYCESADILENLAFSLFDLMAARGAVCLKRGGTTRSPLLHLMSERFASWIEFFSKVEDEDPTSMKPFEQTLLESNIEHKTEIQHSIESLIDGVIHFVQCLYRLELAGGADSEWRDRWTRVSTSQKDQLRRADVSQVWNILSPCFSYWESKEGDLRVFPKLRGCLSTLMELIDPPSPQLLQKLSLDPVFDSGQEELDEALRRGQLPEIVRRSMEERETRVHDVKHLQIYENLYYYYCLAVLEDDTDLTVTDALVTEEALRVVEEQIKWVKMDLAFNSDRHWTWECLGIYFKDATNSFIAVCIRDLTPGVFAASPFLNGVWHTFVRTQRRCFTIAQILAREQNFTEQLEFANEMLTELDVFELTCQIPFLFRTAHLKHSRYTDTWQQVCISVRTALERRISATPSPKWNTLYFAAKLWWKGKGMEWQQETLDAYARSMEAALRDEGGLIDPIYKLHSCRLKLLALGYTNREVLTRHMFNASRSVEDRDTASVVFEDCKEALECCRSRMSGFHVVIYRLAMAFHQRGNHSGALMFIQQLFVKGRKKFCIAMSPVDPRQCRQGQRSVNKAAPSVKISGTGFTEPVWKFTASVRKYLDLYMRLLYCIRDVDQLNIVVETLTKGDYDGPYELASYRQSPYKYPCLSDMAGRALGVKLLLIHDVIHATVPSEVALRMDERIESVLSLLFQTRIFDSDYPHVTHTLHQILHESGQLIQSVREFDLTLFSAALETLCEARCVLSQENTIQALESIMDIHPNSERQGMDAMGVLSHVALYAMVYPLLVLHLKNTALTSRLITIVHQKTFKEGDATSGNLLKRLLFVIVQLLFHQADQLLTKASVITTSDDQRDNTIHDVMQQTSSLIHHYGDVLASSRFLCLRLTFLMRALYDTTCILYDVRPSATISQHAALRVQAQTIGCTIREVRKNTKPPVQSHDPVMHTTSKEAPSTPMEIDAVVSPPQRQPVIEEEATNVQPCLPMNVSSQMSTCHETVKDTVSKVTGDQGSQGGAFSAAFHQSLQHKGSDESTE